MTLLVKSTKSKNAPQRDESCNPIFMCIVGNSMNNILKFPTGGVGAGLWSAGD